MKTLKEMGTTANVIMDLIDYAPVGTKIDKYYLYDHLPHLWPKAIDDAIFQLQINRILIFTKSGYELKKS